MNKHLHLAVSAILVYALSISLVRLLHASEKSDVNASKQKKVVQGKPNIGKAKSGPKKKNRKKKGGSSLKVPEGFSVSIFADKSKINSPISITLDRKNRVYVAEVHRFHRGVVNSRAYNTWFLDEIACRSLEDRKAMNAKWIKRGMFKPDYFTSYSDRITTLTDENQDGKADSVKVFATGFNDELDGPGSSILFGEEGEMYFANIPHIWKIKDTDFDGESETKEKLFSGFGFRYGVAGHDLHGLEWGVDGRLYFSNGDRGYGVKTKEGNTLYDAERGAIYRCEPDGRNLELFCVGNRNPQDLAFSPYGNLFTVDNNRGRGDRSRVNYLVEQGEYGWNSGHENKTTFVRAVKLNLRRGPKPIDTWVTEGDWETQNPSQAAYCIPSLGYIDGGSVGLTMIPGNSMGPEYKNHFVYAAYQRGLYTFKFEPDGGGLKLVNVKAFAEGGRFTDTDFSTDGKLYIAEYGTTGNPKDGSFKGYIYMLENQQYLKEATVKSAHKILSQNLNESSNDMLYENLFHEDMRVRLYSQFALTKRGQAGHEKLLAAIRQKENLLARLHGVWGIGQQARQQGMIKGLAALVTFAADENWRVRSQVMKVLGESFDSSYHYVIKQGLEDHNARVRYFALIALGKVAKGSESQTFELFTQQIKRNQDKDVFLRHAAKTGLLYLVRQYPALKEKLALNHEHESASVRRISLLVLAKLGNGNGDGDGNVDGKYGVLHYLNDSDESIRQEAIRAIDRMDDHGLVMKAYTTLARYTKGKVDLKPGDIERVVQWCFRAGNEEAAGLLAAFAQNPGAPARSRHIALLDLNRWDQKQTVDPVIGQIRPIESHRADTRAILKKTVQALLKLKLDEVDEAYATDVNTIALELGLELNKGMISAQILNQKSPIDTRLSYLNQMLENRDPNLNRLVDRLIDDPELKLRVGAFKAMLKMTPDKFKQKIKEKRADYKAIFQALAQTEGHGQDQYIASHMNQLIGGGYDQAVQLDLLMAAEKSSHENVIGLVKKFQEDISSHKDPLAVYRPTLIGGDARTGRKLVYEMGVGQCIICHKIEDKGGIVAPDLSNLANLKRAEPRYLLESMIDPGAYIVTGYGNMSVTLANDQTLLGSLVLETEKDLTLKFADGTRRKIAKSEIKARTPAMSAMPPMGTILKKHEIRDIIAYLLTLKSGKKDH